MDDLYGNVSSSDDESLSEDKEVIHSSKNSENLEKKNILDLLPDDSDDEENIEVVKLPPSAKNKSLIIEEDVDETSNDISPVENVSKIKDKQQSSQPQFDTSAPKKKVAAVGMSKKKAFSELHVDGRDISIDKDGSMPFYVKLPKFLQFSGDCFDPNNYNAEEERKLYDSASAVIRWCKDPVNPQCVLSNAALVEYDDGSYELVVGGSVFNAKVAPAENCYIFEQKQCTQMNKTHEGVTDNEEKASSCSCLLCCGQVSKRMIFEPSSLDSAAHQRIHFNVRKNDQYHQEKKIGTMDLEKLQETQAINQKQFEKLDERRRSFARQKKRAADSQPRRFAPHRPYMNSQYLEGDEYEDYDDDDDDDDGGKLVAKPKKVAPKKVARRRDVDDDDDDDGESVGNDDEDRSEDDEDDGADLDDFIERDADNGDEDVDGNDIDENSAEDEEEEEEDDDEEEEAVDDDDDDDEDDNDDGSMNVDSDSDGKRPKKGSSGKKGKDSKHKMKKSKSKKEKKGKKSDKRDLKKSDSKKRRREESEVRDDRDDVSVAENRAVSASSEAVKEALQDDDDDEEIVIHQTKKQRKVLLESDEED